MHTHTPACRAHGEKENERVLLFRKIPMRSEPSTWGWSNCKILIFHFTGTNPKADWPARKNSAAPPHNNGVQPHTNDTAQSGDTTRGGWKIPTLTVHTSVPPLTRQVVPEGKQSPSPCVLPAEEWISGNISVPSTFPLRCGRMLHTEFYCVLPASSQTWGLLDNLCIIKHESAISISHEALLVYWPSAICSYTLAK